MKKILAIPLLILIVSCYNPETNCKDFKTGKFKFEYTVDGVKKTTLFERNDSLEIETYDGKTDTASIRWINDCEYILQKTHPKNRVTSKNSYTFEFGMVGEDAKQRGTVIKISNK
jgi:hypothetical protein